jgi:hypothetical protein
MATSAFSGSSRCRHAIGITLRIALVLCLATFAAAADAGTCNGSDREQGTCSSAKEMSGPSYDILCRASFERIDELNHLAQSDAAVFVPQAWAWIEEAGKCVYAIDNHIIAEPSPSSSSTLKSHIVAFLRSVLSLDTSALTPPPGACAKMLLAKKKKSLRKFFTATVPGGGLHPDLNIKVRAHCAIFVAQSARLFMHACSGLHVEYFFLRRREHQRSHWCEGRVFVHRHTLRNGIGFHPILSPPPSVSIQSIKNLALPRKAAHPPEHKQRADFADECRWVFVPAARAARCNSSISPQLLPSS